MKIPIDNYILNINRYDDYRILAKIMLTLHYYPTTLLANLLSNWVGKWVGEKIPVKVSSFPLLPLIR